MVKYRNDFYKLSENKAGLKVEMRLTGHKGRYRIICTLLMHPNLDAVYFVHQ